MALTAAGSGSASLFFKVLAYLPPTAPFAMPVLVGLGTVDVVGVPRLGRDQRRLHRRRGAAWPPRIYRRAILRTGGRVKLRDVLSRATG